ncbi:hypothetical protein [Streptomyces sp. NPDC051577]|uniref:hypothetical protein n=1 Tax=Streptomyces sp. NPDC051577 TaxID=3155166 RepID=UPI003412A9B2
MLTLDRLINSNHHVVMNGPSYRPTKPTSSEGVPDGRPMTMSVRNEIVSRMVDAHEAENDVEHAVIARYRLAGGRLGEPGQREVVRKAQALLTEAIDQAEVGEFDGNEYGGGEVSSSPTDRTPMHSSL